MNKEKCISYIKSRGVTDDHVAETIYNDALLQGHKAMNYLLGNFFQKDRKYGRDFTTVESEEHLRLDAPVSEEDGSRLLIEIIPSETLDNKKLTNQRQLIRQLTDEEDSRMTAIINEFLNQDKPTITSVSNSLGLDRKQVRRKLDEIKKRYNPEIHVSVDEALCS
ncbi:hypothetical protein [Abyssicoccus albus]|uniref:Uncharacterized protein n=1 Tax=Abyssicoccus albus TaxID=1817405 RepID=A0A3N5BBJ4_9BACL|nr:hypothetical protein [Abyssicoccus albus]RPF54777.1 hypothetical protein EDD62_1738 [Abyssicoccus albus]